MEFRYDHLTTQDLRGTSRAELLVNIEANLSVVDADGPVFQEDLFPVAELARDLSRWAAQPEEKRENFEWESMSYDEKGTVRIHATEAGWRLGSVQTPDSWSRPVSWPELLGSIRDYVARVRRDIEALGIDSAFIEANDD
ncbi:hypothetical protein [Streptomyces sp. NPDC052701]|uniref:DUF7878 domain-containing protein n=1 Tax=Streptomyces sp. NPDC052701 TaxID=3155533 RepID=UPI003434D4FB